MTTAPYDHEALWTKAKLFINRAMDSDGKPFDEQAIWAALSLELLAKAALARVSPLLIAVPTEEGVNLLIAAGLVEGPARFTSVPAKTLLARCHKAFKPFNDKQAQIIMNARNDYLHGARPGFTEMPPDAWWPRYWAQTAVLVNAMDRVISDLVGHTRAAVVEAYLAKNAQNIEHRVEMLIERARQRLSLSQAGTLPAHLAAEWSRPANLNAGLSHSTAELCPACGDMGLLEGDHVIDAEPHYEQVSVDDFDAWMDLRVAADYFSCENCRLVLDGYELLEQAELSVEFEATGDYAEYIGDDYGND
jgi:hypothetical protein